MDGIHTTIAFITMLCCALLSSCTDDDMPQPAPSGDSRAMAASRSLDAGEGQTAWRDIRGFDPSLPGQAVEVELPVSCGGAETSVTARLSIMPMHVYEENGPDRLGDYYVVEADFTAHNGPMWEKGMFMKSLDVKVTPTDKQGNSIPGIAFHDNPTPATTVANQTFRASTTAGVLGGSFLGRVPKTVERYIGGYAPFSAINQYVFVRAEKGYFCRLENKIEIPLEFNEIKVCTPDAKYNVLLEDTWFSPGNSQSYIMFDGNVPEVLKKRVFLAEAESKRYYRSDGNTLEIYTYEVNPETGAPILDAKGNIISTEGITTLFDSESGMMMNGIYPGQEGHPVLDCNLLPEYENGIRSLDGRVYSRCRQVIFEKGYLFTAFVSGGYSWSKEQSIRLEDVTTSLRTATDCVVEYLYTVENYRSGRGIPEAARGDFHGHATWVWRMPVRDSSLTPEELVSSLYDMHIEVSPVYAAAGSPDRNLLPATATVSHSEALEPPMRGKCTAVDFSNPSGAAVGRVRLLSVPYAEWDAAGRPDNDVVAEYDGTLGRGQSCTLAAPDMDCWVVCEEFDPLTLRYGRVRQSLPLHVRMDACNPRPLEVSTLDTSAVQ